MPTAGTHITVIERLALDPDLAPLLGDPNADADDPAGLQMRYAKLGAIGPDLFYAMLDYGGDVQDLVNFFAKYSGAIECISHVMEDLSAFTTKVESDITFGVSDTAKQTVDEIKQVVVNTSAVIKEIAMVVVTDGFNFFTIFEAQRQQDKPRHNWYWADYLHYIRSGQFVSALFRRAGNDPNLRAYAYGYLSHYITDVVGHPFVNQVVGAPWRMYWQRHHLVENFIDAYVWARWHDAHPAPPPPPPSTEEAPLDSIRTTPRDPADLANGAPFTYARLNDHIHIGDPAGVDPVDQVVIDICKKIDGALEDIGVAEPMPQPPGDAGFVRWTEMLAEAFRDAYPASAQPPDNLRNPALHFGATRPDGYPTREDIGSAYVVLRMFLRSATEEKIKEPEIHDIGEDVWNAIKKLIDKVAQDLGSITPPPHISVGGSFSLKSLWDSIKDWVSWACDTAAKLAEAAIDALRGLLNVAGTVIVDMVRAVTYLIKKALYELYKAIRFFLVRTAYAMPFTDELNDTIAGTVSARWLWTVPRRGGFGSYPFEEVPDPERTQILSSYTPWASPETLPQVQALAQPLEMPATWPGPYKALATPDAFLDPAAGPRAMLAASSITAGPLSLAALPDPTTGRLPNSTSVPDFGGAVANCAAAFKSVAQALATNTLTPTFFPDYNLDGDRGYGWPCWDVSTPPNGLNPVNSAGTPHPVNVMPVAVT